MDRRRSRGAAVSPARGRSVKVEQSPEAAPVKRARSQSKERIASPRRKASEIVASVVVDDNRRPLTTRETGAAKWASRTLAGMGATPNGVSVASMFFACMAAACFYYAGLEVG